MDNFYAAKAPNKVWGLALITLMAFIILACAEVDPENPNSQSSKIEDKCFELERAWAIGERYTKEGDRVKYIELPPYSESTENGNEDIKWVHLETEINGEIIGAVKFKELLVNEVPEGAGPGEFVKFLLRIDLPKWSFVPDIKNIKVGGSDTIPPKDVSPELLVTHNGVATQESGDDWEYYEAVLMRYQYYVVSVASQKEVECDEE